MAAISIIRAGLDAERARHYGANPSERWNDAEREGQRTIAEATFDRIEAFGIDRVVHPSAEADRYGWSEAFGSEPLVCSIGHSGRGQRNSTVMSDAGTVVRFVRKQTAIDLARMA